MSTDTKNENHRKDDVRPTRPLTWADTAPAGAHLVDVMIDTETLGTTPGSVILSIGAVMFGPAGLGQEFYAPISLASCTAVGLTIDAGTVAWWMKQSDAACAAAFRDDAEPLAAVLEQFTSWFNLVEAERPWAQGANFDPPLLEAAYRACGMTPPWKFWNVRDTRTLYHLADVRVDRARGTHHNALDDARAQAEAAVVALQRLHDARRPAEAKDAECWTKAPPTEQADYWHWDGDPDHAPMIYHVLWSGTAKKCFVSIGQYGIENAIWCDLFGGWWLKIEQPSIPQAQSSAKGGDAVGAGGQEGGAA